MDDQGENREFLDADENILSGLPTPLEVGPEKKKVAINRIKRNVTAIKSVNNNYPNNTH